jgi:predicted N-acetyltransferase YhbS
MSGSAMHMSTYILRPETSSDDAEIEALHDLAFGPGRFVRTAQRLRDGVPHDPDLSLVAEFGGRVGGSVRLTPIRIGETPAQLLGPLAVHPDFGNKGAGKALVRASLEAAREMGWPLVLLVGDHPYYGPLGFHHTDPQMIRMPGPVDTRRVLLAELQPGAAAKAEGMVRNWRWG